MFLLSVFIYKTEVTVYFFQFLYVFSNHVLNSELCKNRGKLGHLCVNGLVSESVKKEDILS